MKANKAFDIANKINYLSYLSIVRRVNAIIRKKARKGYLYVTINFDDVKPAVENKVIQYFSKLGYKINSGTGRNQYFYWEGNDNE